jgi:hypothetical protein
VATQMVFFVYVALCVVAVRRPDAEIYGIS